jgi:hypothetical protein
MSEAIDTLLRSYTMFASFVLAAALLAQTPPTPARGPTQQPAIAAQARAQVEKNRAKRAVKAQRYTTNRAAEDRAAAIAAAQAQAAYKAALPYMLENQRQQLQFQAQTQGNVLRYQADIDFNNAIRGVNYPR